MKFTKEELCEMRKLAGIEYSAVDYRRPKDMLSESTEAVEKPAEEKKPEEKTEGKLPKQVMPGKKIPEYRTKSSGKKISLQSLIQKGKGSKEAGSHRSVPVEK